MADNPSHNAMIHVDPNNASSFVELTGVTQSSLQVLLEKIMTSEYGDDGERSIGGRKDFKVDLTFKLDLAVAGHRDFLDSLRDGELVGVRVFPVRSVTTNYFSAVCLFTNLSLDLPNSGVVSASATLENADGNVWAYANA